MRKSPSITISLNQNTQGTTACLIGSASSSSLGTSLVNNTGNLSVSPSNLSVGSPENTSPIMQVHHDVNIVKREANNFHPSPLSMSNQLHPPFRFRCIAPNIFIGAYPTLRNLRYLKRLKLKTIISLIPEKPITDLREFCEYENINLYHIYTQKYKEQVSLSFSEVSTIIEMFLNAKQHPIYCHCLDGTQVSSVLVMCFRKLQNWSKTAMKNETARYTSELSSEDNDFVKQWKGPIKIDKRLLPDWVKNLSPFVQLLLTHEKKHKKNKSAPSTEEDEHVLKHVSGIKIILEGEEEKKTPPSNSFSQDSSSHSTISVHPKNMYSPNKKINLPTVDMVKVKSSKSAKLREYTRSADSLSGEEGDEETTPLREFGHDEVPAFVETRNTSKKDKPSLQLRGLDLEYTSEKQRQQVIVWKNKKTTFKDLEIPEEMEEFLDDMEDPFIHDEFLSFQSNFK